MLSTTVKKLGDFSTEYLNFQSKDKIDYDPGTIMRAETKFNPKFSVFDPFD